MLPQSIAELATRLGISLDHLVEIASSANSRYRHCRIPKRGGGQRQIDEPAPELKAIQRRLLEQVLVAVPVHPAATAFRPGASVQSNASVHASQRFVYNTDVADFFPSITRARVVGLFVALGMPPDVAQLQGKLVCYRGRLPQGAPTSPAIANLIARKLDLRITGYCDRRSWRYTRYADDITISGNGVFRPRDQAWVEQCVEAEGFAVNHDKTRLARQHQAQVVTGVNVNQCCRLPRSQRQRLRAIFHQAEIDPGLFSDRVEELRGHLAWLRAVEPDNPNIRRYEAVLDKLEGSGPAARASELATLAKGIREILGPRRPDADGSCD